MQKLLLTVCGLSCALQAADVDPEISPTGIHHMDVVGAPQRSIEEVAAPLLEIARYPDQRTRIISLLEHISREDRVQFVAQVMHLTPDDISFNIMHALMRVPREERAEFVAHVPPLLEGIPNDYERSNVMRVFANIPREGRAEFVARVSPLLEGVTNPRDRIYLIDTLARVPAEEISVFPDQVAPLLVEPTAMVRDDGQLRTVIISFFTRIPQDERVEFANQVAYLFSGIVDGTQRWDIMEAATDGNNRIDVIQRAIDDLRLHPPRAEQRAERIVQLLEVPLDMPIHALGTPPRPRVPTFPALIDEEIRATERVGVSTSAECAAASASAAGGAADY